MPAFSSSIQPCRNAFSAGRILGLALQTLLFQTLLYRLPASSKLN